MILGLQLVGLLFGLFVIYMSYVLFRKKGFNRLELCTWSITGAIVAIISLFPQLLGSFSQKIQVTTKLDILLAMGLIFFIVIYYVYRNIRSTRVAMEKLVRELALLRAKK